MANETAARGLELGIGAVDAALYSALLADPHVEGPDGRKHVILPATHKLVAVEDEARLLPFVDQVVTVYDRASITAYLNRFGDARSIILSDYETGTITGHLDWHGESDSGTDSGGATVQPNRHRAVLKLLDSEEFKRWSGMQGKLHAQAAFAAFLEENAEDIVDPDPARMIEISRDLEAHQGVNFKASNRLESGDRTFVYETETRVKGDITIPREFRIAIPLYQGEDPVELRCAFRFRIQEGGLLLGFEWRRVEYQRQAYFAQVAHRIAEDAGRPVFLGRPR